ncbi:MAG: sigma-70 family RNA polymerase sigma factor [Clostridia bacterium]
MKKILSKVINFLKKFFKNEKSVNYIVSLPTPLDREEEAIAIAKLDTGDLEARNLLIERNLRLVVYIAKRFDNTGIELDELISVGSVGLIKAVKSYNSDKKIKLATYASKCIENEILMFLRKSVRRKGEISLDEPLNVDWEGNQLVLSDILGTDGELMYKEMETNVENDILHDLYLNLDTRDRAIMGMRYGLFGIEEKTQKEIADMMNISQSYISRLEKKIIGKLRKEFCRIDSK